MRSLVLTDDKPISRSSYRCYRAPGQVMSAEAIPSIDTGHSVRRNKRLRHGTGWDAIAMLSDEQKQFYLQALQGYTNKTQVQLCQELQISPGRLTRILGELGLATAPMRRKTQRVDVPKEVLQNLIDAGHCPEQIRRALGISNRALYRLVKAYGLTLLTRVEITRRLAAQGLRRCHECKQIKSLANDFYQDRTDPLGRNPRCKECLLQHSRRHRQLRKLAPANVSSDIAAPGEPARKCAGCGQIKLLETDFEPDPKGYRYRSNYCWDCRARQRDNASIEVAIADLERMGLRRCCRCHKTKRLDQDFAMARRNRAGRAYACKECLRQDAIRRQKAPSYGRDDSPL